MTKRVRVLLMFLEIILEKCVNYELCKTKDFVYGGHSGIEV